MVPSASITQLSTVASRPVPEPPPKSARTPIAPATASSATTRRAMISPVRFFLGGPTVATAPAAAG